MNAAQKTVFYDVSTGETKIIRNTLSVENEADLAVHVESNVITFNKDLLKNSPWGSRSLTLKQDPRI